MNVSLYIRQKPLKMLQWLSVALFVGTDTLYFLHLLGREGGQEAMIWPVISTVLLSTLAGCSLEFFDINISQIIYIIYIASSKACSSFYILYFME